MALYNSTIKIESQKSLSKKMSLYVPLKNRECTTLPNADGQSISNFEAATENALSPLVL